MAVCGQCLSSETHGTTSVRLLEDYLPSLFIEYPAMICFYNAGLFYMTTRIICIVLIQVVTPVDPSLLFQYLFPHVLPCF